VAGLSWGGSGGVWLGGCRGKTKTHLGVKPHKRAAGCKKKVTLHQGKGGMTTPTHSGLKMLVRVDEGKEGDRLNGKSIRPLRREEGSGNHLPRETGEKKKDGSPIRKGPGGGELPLACRLLSRVTPYFSSQR